MFASSDDLEEYAVFETLIVVTTYIVVINYYTQSSFLITERAEKGEGFKASAGGCSA